MNVTYYNNISITISPQNTKVSSFTYTKEMSWQMFTVESPSEFIQLSHTVELSHSTRLSWVTWHGWVESHGTVESHTQLHHTVASYGCIALLHHTAASYGCIVQLHHTVAPLDTGLNTAPLAHGCHTHWLGTYSSACRQHVDCRQASLWRMCIATQLSSIAHPTR